MILTCRPIQSKFILSPLNSGNIKPFEIQQFTRTKSFRIAGFFLFIAMPRRLDLAGKN